MNEQVTLYANYETKQLAEAVDNVSHQDNIDEVVGSILLENDVATFEGTTLAGAKIIAHLSIADYFEGKSFLLN